jgi:hypothetical protein
MAIWKVSYVIQRSQKVGGIINLNHQPEVGELITIGDLKIEITEAVELIPPRGEFHYIHATCVIKDQK